MQSTDRANYFCSIREYVTAMNDRRYPNPTILLLARKSGTFYEYLMTFWKALDMEEKRKKLQRINYPLDRQDDFIRNVNVTICKPYYLIYYEQGCPVHCIFLDKLKLLFE